MLQIMGWVLAGIPLLILVLLLFPVYTRVRYDGALQVWCGFGPIALQVFPLKKKKRTLKLQQSASGKQTRKKEKPTKPKQKLTLETLCSYIHLGTEGLSIMRRRLVVKDLTLHLKIAGNDAAKAALTYGKTAAAVSSLYPVLENSLQIRKSDIMVDLDFEHSNLDILADLTIAACPLRLLISAVILSVRFLRIWKKAKNDQSIKEKEGGILHEQH